MIPDSTNEDTHVDAPLDAAKSVSSHSPQEARWPRVRHALRVLVDTVHFRSLRMTSNALRPAVTAPDDALAIEQCIEWLRNYIGHPHPELGRKGDICPFVNVALNRGRMTFHVYPAIKEITARRLGMLLVDEGLRLLSRLDHDDSEVELTTVNVLLPHLGKEHHHALHDAHTLCKTTLMRRGLMISVFFPDYERPGVYNPAFKLYQSPFPIVTLRPMALHDIVFLERNEEGFKEYRRRFGKKYAAGRVPEKYGYIERYNSAIERFALERD